MVDQTEERDSQKDLVYWSEWSSPSFINNIDFASKSDAHNCFEMIIKSKVWKNRFATERELKLGFDENPKFAGRYWPAGIYLNTSGKEYYTSHGCVKLHPKGRNLHILLHEMTHHVIDVRYPKAEPHGPKFAWWLVAMVSSFFSKNAGAGLALSMKIHGVRARK